MTRDRALARKPNILFGWPGFHLRICQYLRVLMFGQSETARAKAMSHPERRLLLYPYPFERTQGEDVSEFHSQAAREERDTVSDLIELTPIATSVAHTDNEYYPHSNPSTPNTTTINRANDFDAHRMLQNAAFNSSVEQQTARIRQDLFTNGTANGIRDRSRDSDPSALYYRFPAAENSTSSSTEIYSSEVTRDAQYIEKGSNSEIRDEWLNFSVFEYDGGEYSREYCINNMLANDDSVYCSRSRTDVNVILARASKFSQMLPAPFKLNEVHVRIPSKGFTSPLRNGFLFVCSKEVCISEFERYNLIPTAGLLDANGNRTQTLPKVPSCVLTVLYFQLDRSTNEFHYTFTTPIKSCRYIFIKFLTSFGAKDSIDIEFVGFRGVDGKLCFPVASLL